MTRDAHAYAAEVRARRIHSCDCPACKQSDALPAVLRIVANWPMPKTNVRQIKARK